MILKYYMYLIKGITPWWIIRISRVETIVF
uniref:Uncharacterized protein n=1 Tax=Anguilla anguilla TaxID=7936 RepID=A0A0E9Q0C9_ANGAN